MRTCLHLAVAAVVAVVLAGYCWKAQAADPKPSELLDLASPEGVDRADIERLMRIVLGLEQCSEQDILRADVTPAVLLSAQTAPYPHEVRPNPVPANVPDVGEVVLATRRAAGHIVFSQLNASPVVKLNVGAPIVNTATYSISGVMTDDKGTAGAIVQVWLNGAKLDAEVPVNASGTFTVSVTLKDGENSFYAKGRDADGRFGVPCDPVAVLLDTKKPVLTVASPAAGAYVSVNPVAVSGTAADENGLAAVTVGGLDALLIDMSPEPWLWQGQIPFAAAGPKTVTIQARDKAGNLSDAVSLTVIYDNVAPVVAFGPIPTPTNTPVLHLFGTADDDRKIGGVVVNGVAALVDVAAETWAVDLPLKEGSNKYVAVATDAAGNVSAEVALTVVGDFTLPVLNMLSSKFTNKTPYTWQFSISEAITLAKLNGKDDGRFFDAKSFTLSGYVVDEGANTVKLQVRDVAGNVADFEFSVLMDTVAPVIKITSVDKTGSQFSPLGGVNGVITDAPAVNIAGTAMDLASGVATVTVNGYEADVADGKFQISGIPLVPRSNGIKAEATDAAGNVSGDAITVIQDVEGPKMTLSFPRGASISATGQFNEPAKRRYTGASNITVTGTVKDMYLGVSSIVATWNGTPLTMTWTAGSQTFSFVVPSAQFAGPKLAELKVVAKDSFQNENADYQNASQGVFNLRNTILTNALGLALGETSVSVLAGMVETMVEAMDGSTVKASITQALHTFDIQGITFCRPSNLYDGGGRAMNPPVSRYGCTQNVTVTMSFDSAGQVQIQIYIPYLLADSYLHWTLLCFNDSEAYVKIEPAIITLKANFVNSPSGPSMQLVPNSVAVSVNGFAMETQDCGLINWLLGLLQTTLVSAVQSAFTDQIGTILGTVGAELQKPLYTAPNSGFQLAIEKMSNNKTAQGFTGISIWLKSIVNPCTSESKFTDTLDEESIIPGAYVPCPSTAADPLNNDYYWSPGSLVSGQATTPALSLTDSQGKAVGFNALANQDFVNQFLFNQWAQGGLEIVVDQTLVGDALTLDTQAFSIFIPELGNPLRTDVQAVAPTGTPLQIKVHFSLPPTVLGATGAMSFKAGDLFLKFMGDPNKDGVYDIPLFTLATGLSSPVNFKLTSATKDTEWDMLAVELGEMSMTVDLMNEAFPLGESGIRASIPMLMQMIKPMISNIIGAIPLPGSGMRIKELLLATNRADYLNVKGDMQASLAINSPATVVTGNFQLKGQITSLKTDAGGNYSIETTALVGPMATWPTPVTTITGIVVTKGVEAGKASITVPVLQSQLAVGDNIVMVILRDRLFPGGTRTSYVKLVINKSFTGETLVTAGLSEATTDLLGGLVGGLGMGCSYSAKDAAAPLPLLLVLALFLGLRVLPRRARGLLALLPLLVFFGCGGGGSTGHSPGFVFDTLGDLGDIGDGQGREDGLYLDGKFRDGEGDLRGDDAGPNFNGVPIDKNPAVIFTTIAIGGPNDGFNLDESSPGGDPDPDNAVTKLGAMANGKLGDALSQGTIIILMKIVGLSRLPAPGERGEVSIVGYLGKDLDEDPTNNFDGQQHFGIDPASFTEDGKLLIEFPKAEVYADEGGVVHLTGGPSVFTLSVPLDETGAAINLSIHEARFEAILTPSGLRPKAIDMNQGLLGGIMPCSVLATPIEALGGIAPLMILKAYVDIDLNGDGVLDKTNKPDNPDGISAAVLFAGVPAYVDEDSANLAPKLTMDEVPKTVAEPLLPLSGTFADPDGDCMKGKVGIKVNGGDAAWAGLSKKDKLCIWTAEVFLAAGANELVITGEDQKGATAQAGATVTLIDETPPVLELAGPYSGTTGEAAVGLAGKATDNIGIQAVQIAVAGGSTYIVNAADLADDGSFSLTVELPVPGLNTITGQARDFSDNLSNEATVEVIRIDEDPPQLFLDWAEDAEQRLSPPQALEFKTPGVKIRGHIIDNFGCEELSALLVAGAAQEPLELKKSDCSFEKELVLELGLNQLQVQALDKAGNSASLDIALTWTDVEAPAILVKAPAPLVNEKAQTLVFEVTDNAWPAEKITASVSLNGLELPAPVLGEGLFSSELVLLGGDNAVRIRAVDGSGNPAEKEFVVKLEDLDSPKLDIKSPEDGKEVTDTSVTVSGTISDNIGFGSDAVTVEIGGETYTPEVAADGTFSVKVDLALGENSITVTGTDSQGQVSQAFIKVVRRDPNEPVQLELTAEPQTIVRGGGSSVLRAAVTRYAGGPVPAGLAVEFLLSDETLGRLGGKTVLTDSFGVASVSLTALDSSGTLTITAQAGKLSDQVEVNVANPTLSLLSICSKGGITPFAGLDFQVKYAGAAVLGNPGADSLKMDSLLSDFYFMSDRKPEPRLLLAGPRLLSGTVLLFMMEWPIEQGAPQLADFQVLNARTSTLIGAVKPTTFVKVCTVDNKLGDLPPSVRIQPLPATVTDAKQFVNAVIGDADLAGCTGVLKVNGFEQNVDVTKGSISVEVTLAAGTNTIALTVRDAGGKEGKDSITVFLSTPNNPPSITVKKPGTTTSAATATFEGVVTDDGPLAQVTVRAKSGNADWIPCPVAADTGAWICSQAIALSLGNNTVRFEAADALGGLTSISYTVRRIEPVLPPKVTITEPAEGATFQKNPVTLSGTVADGGNPAQIVVKLWVNGKESTLTWDFFSRTFTAKVSLDDGKNQIRVRAEDVTGGFDEKTRELNFSAPDLPPTLEVTSPENGIKTAADKILVKGNIIDDRGLSTLKTFTANGVVVTVEKPDQLESAWSVTVPLKVGSNTITVSVTDKAGNKVDQTRTVSNVEPPAVVLDAVRIGSATEGFNVDQVGSLGDKMADNALSGLGAVANPILVTQLVDPEKPLLIMLEFQGLASLPKPGDPPVTVDIVGYMGEDLDADRTDNFSGSETFAISPKSYDPVTGQPLIRFPGVEIKNVFGKVRIVTFPDKPALFNLAIEVGADTGNPSTLTIKVQPAFMDTTLSEATGGGVKVDDALLGGVVPAGLLAMTLDLEGLSLNPLALLIKNDPANPVPDVDLNADGKLATNPATDATAANPDGVSVGLKAHGVPCKIQK